MRRTFTVTLVLSSMAMVLCGLVVTGCGAGTGACVGSGGVLSSPECKPDWDESECADWNSQQINDATWTFHGGDGCEDLGYTAECSDGSFRRPGAC
ncbi:MAG: hypothetical protein V3T05_04180 [Myxococcota bacterium]